MQNSSLRWGWIISIALFAKIIMIPLTYLYMVIYSYGIHPGENAAFYETYVFENRAWIASGLALIVYFLLAWWMGRKVKEEIMMHSILIAGIGILINIPLELAFGDIENYMLPLLVANVMPFLGAWLGGKKAGMEVD